MDYQLRPCTEKQLPEILTIFNDAILHSTALYDYKIRTMDTMLLWYADKLKHNHPIIGIFGLNNQLLGFTTFGAFRIRPAYKYTVEHSVYVHPNMRGNGLGKILLREIIKKAQEQDYHVLIGVIDSSNTVSIELHKNAGFVLTGVIKEVGYKFGKWLDAAFYQLILETPKEPHDD